MAAIIPDATTQTKYALSEDPAKFGVPGLTTRVFSFGDLRTWAGESVDLKWGQMIRWAANSEKWFLEQGCHYYDGVNPFKAEEAGTDMAAFNWIDKAGIYVSHNPYSNCKQATQIDANCAVAAGPFYGNDAGDLFVFGGPANSYEKVDGTWQSIPPVGPEVSVQRRYQYILPGDLKVCADNQGNLRISLGREGFTAHIADMSGRIVWICRATDGTAIIRAGVLRQGVYVLRITGTAGLSRIKIAL
jgi:hypothetical protein